MSDVAATLPGSFLLCFDEFLTELLLFFLSVSDMERAEPASRTLQRNQVYGRILGFRDAKPGQCFM